MTQTNIELAFPHLSPKAKQELTHASLRELAWKSFELLSTWHRPLEKVRADVQRVDCPDELLAPVRKPTLILLPHLGNWELFGAWLSSIRPYTALFRPLRAPMFTDVVKTARERGGNTLVPTTPTGIKTLLRDLKAGKQVIVLPDQSPTDGGVFAPFFKIETATTTLPYRLASATGAQVILGTAVWDAGAYRIVMRTLPSADQLEQSDWLSHMNAEIEKLVSIYPAQYQWEYRRFRKAPDGSLRYP
jgi:KDO2-lipid IV(A) lauroyltransferase